MLPLTLGLLVGLPQFPVVQSSEFTADAQSKALAATVRVLVPARFVEGSGVVIGSDRKGIYVLTAAHIVEPDDAIEVQAYTSKTFPKPSEIFAKVDLVATSDSLRDLALLRLPPAKIPLAQLRLAPGTTASPKTPFNCLVVGCLASNPPRAHVDRVLAATRARRDADEEPAWFWEVAAKQGAGQSGGPLVDSRGLVLGLCSGNNKDRSYFCHLDEIQAFLRANKHEWLYDAEPAPKTNGDLRIRPRLNAALCNRESYDLSVVELRRTRFLETLIRVSRKCTRAA